MYIYICYICAINPYEIIDPSYTIPSVFDFDLSKNVNHSHRLSGILTGLEKAIK
jgi:hypothetical protein